MVRVIRPVCPDRADIPRKFGPVGLRCYWVRTAAAAAGTMTAWQELVDSLVIAGKTTLAPYSD
jgi:hypothetical protein